MSSAFAIAGVSAVLQYQLYNYLNNNLEFAPPPKVTCLAPDQMQSTVVDGGANDPENQINLFLYQVSHNAAWRNAEFASLAPDGSTRIGNPPLALDLHYLLTVYAKDNWLAEALLGYALMMLHETPVLSRDSIVNALTTASLSTFSGDGWLINDIVASGLADQIEMIKITPESMTKEEMAWLWTALKADYRPTYPFQASVVLMQPQQQTGIATPVANRRLRVVPIQPSRLLTVQQQIAQPGDQVTVMGEFLAGASTVVLTQARSGFPLSLPATSPRSSSLQFTLPTSGYPAGVYSLAVQFVDAQGDLTQITNSLPIALSPKFATQTATTASVDSPSSDPVGARLQAPISGISPQVLTGQVVSLTLIDQSSTAPAAYTSQDQIFAGPASDTVDFLFNPSQSPPLNVPLLARLQVDGATSLIGLSGAPPPAFDAPLVTLQ
jgi:hypothetical protein